MKFYNKKMFKLIITMLMCWIVFLMPHLNSLNNLPQGMHGWAQSDRYALALNFLNSNNVIQPKTNALYTENGKVGVEFSGMAFLAAKIATLSNTPKYLPLLFKGLNLLLLSFLITLFLNNLFPFDLIYSIGNLFIWFASPLLLYYGFNFIPDSLGFGFAICSLGCYYKYHQSNQNNYLLLALMLGGLGGLTKLPVLIYPIAIIVHQFYLAIIAKRMNKQTMVYLALGILVIVCVVLYDYVFLIKANEKLWSVIFMGKPNPILSVNDLVEALSGMFYWRFEYLNIFQFALLGILLLKSLVGYPTLPRFYLQFGVIISFGLVIYFVGLGKQLIHHDYYFLSSFFPFLVFVGSLLIIRITKTYPINYKPLFLIAAVLVTFKNFNQAKARQADYYTIRTNTLDNNLQWLRNGESKLENAGIGANELIFVLYDFAPNTSLVYFNRKGLVFNHEQMSRKEPHIEFWMEKLKPNYLIVKKDWEKDFYRDKPTIANSWIRIPEDGFIIYKRP